MSSKTRQREEFLLSMQREGIPADVARGIMRDAATLQRFAENDCNLPDWRDRCYIGKTRHNYDADRCECAACRRERAAEDRIKARLAPFGAVPIFNGDPRGAVVKIKVSSGRTDDWGREGICVP